jgi:hypothetical protein
MDFVNELCQEEIEKFVTPTNIEIGDWIRQTEGMYTNEILIWLGKSPDPKRENVKYIGKLTLPQQWFILCDLEDDSKLQEDKMENLSDSPFGFL